VTSPQNEFQSLYADVNGQRLHYKKWPENGPPLIFLHGVTSSSSAWDYIVPGFASDYSVTAFDFRGHGQSSKPESGYKWAEHYGADIVAFVKEHISEPAIIIGHSLGAMVTVPVAVSVPDKVRAIVMEDPPAFASADTADRFKPTLMTKRLPPEMRVERFMETQGLNRGAAERRSEELEAMRENVLVELLEGGTRYDPEEWFPKVSCPSLVILGSPERGGVVKWEDRPRLQRLLKGSRMVEWDDVGHLVHFQKMERFIAEVKSFLASLP
jgi:pimeloyl-ACP methyl ester carboxylesterase